MARRRDPTPVLILLLLAAATSCVGAPRMKRIVGGSPAAIADFPWQLSLRYDGSHTCGAAVIGAEWALTAKSCVATDHLEHLQLRAGSAARSSGGSLHNVTEAVRHYLALPTTMDYDFALLKVSPAFNLDDPNVKAAALPEEGSDPPAGTAVTATGWGRNGTSVELPETLEQVSSAVLERADCEAQLGAWYVTEHMVCAGASDRGLVCWGDTGGPLVSGSTLLGVVPTTGVSCDEQPSVFCRVSDVRSWITDNTGI
ncbi:trypsin-2-like [Schistocerca serialis cubense]|uniref:trypsin-2-like n=1 Tax=Schistocerca serialis cubense TaxID=2023355 RepID=UPI00214E0C23|nr:trypsin-2-like [Schistocerca serialis cubense]